MPTGVTAVMLSALVGALAGVGTPRAAYRFSVAWGEPPHAGCADCRLPFDPGFPGWVRGGARCRACGSRQGPSRWWTVPVGAGSAALLAACLSTARTPGAGWVLAAALVLSVLGVLLAAIDVAVLRLPDPIVGVAALAVLVLLALAAGTAGDWSAYARALTGALALLGSFGLLSLLTGGQVGLGDVKLAGVLGLLLGWLSWGAVLLGGLSALLLNGLVALTLLALGRIGRKGAVPMGPSLLAGALLAVLAARLVSLAVA